MAPSSDRTTRIPSDVASPVTANHAAKESVFVDLTNAGNLQKLASSAGREGERVGGCLGIRRRPGRNPFSEKTIWCGAEGMGMLNGGELRCSGAAWDSH